MCVFVWWGIRTYMHVHARTYGRECMWKLEDNSWELELGLRSAGLVVYLPNHLTGPKSIIYFILFLSQMPPTLTLSSLTYKMEIMKPVLLTGLLRGSNEPVDCQSVQML